MTKADVKLDQFIGGLAEAFDEALTQAVGEDMGFVVLVVPIGRRGGLTIASNLHPLEYNRLINQAAHGLTDLRPARGVH